MRRTVTLATSLALPVLVALLALAGSVDARTVATGEWVGDSGIDAEVAADTLNSKPRNTWTTADLRDAGWKGCRNVLTDVPTYERPPVAHVVRLPVAEGWDYVRMTPAEVASRIEAFGGTATTADDVKIIANCY
jgi:hypothetical protein